MHTNPETLGDIIKYYREKSDYTVEELANKVGITERYLYRIENEGKKPSYDVLCSIIHKLVIPPSFIFFPNLSTDNTVINRITQLLSSLDEQSLNMIEKMLNIYKDSEINR